MITGGAEISTVLLIEDDASLAYALARSLAHAGHRVLTAIDGASALKILEANDPIDLLLTDLVMPKGQPHGLAITRMARMKRVDLAVIFMTGHPDLLKEVGDDKILLKPVETDLILEEISTGLHLTQH